MTYGRQQPAWRSPRFVGIDKQLLERDAPRNWPDAETNQDLGTGIVLQTSAVRAGSSLRLTNWHYQLLEVSNIRWIFQLTLASGSPDCEVSSENRLLSHKRLDLPAAVATPKRKRERRLLPFIFRGRKEKGERRDDVDFVVIPVPLSPDYQLIYQYSQIVQVSLSGITCWLLGGIVMSTESTQHVRIFWTECPISLRPSGQ